MHSTGVSFVFIYFKKIGTKCEQSELMRHGRALAQDSQRLFQTERPGQWQQQGPS